MNINRSNKIFVMLFLPVVMSGACETEVILPIGAQLSISPDSYIVQSVVQETQGNDEDEDEDEDEACSVDTSTHQDIPLLFQITTEDGIPIGDAAFSILVEYAGHSYSGEPRLALFDDFNSNGVIDEESELISGDDNAVATARTDKWHGTKSLMLRIYLSCEFTATLFAYSGTVQTQAQISVVRDASR